MTRPTSTDRLTLAEVVALAKVSYAVAYRLVARTTTIPSAEQAPDGVWTIARHDLHLIRRREPKYPEGRKPFYVRAGLDRAAAWERAAGTMEVTAWLAMLADAASGYRE